MVEKENFLALTQDEGWNVLALGSSYEAIQWLKKNNDTTLAVIGENAAPLNAYQTFDYIRQELKSELPVVISRVAGTGNKQDGYMYIEKPYSANTVKNLKQLIEPNSGTPAQKVYSLEYLETISGGNQEFLIDCLRTFISSVSDKMAELDTAVSNNDSKNIGAIAHNIKPSFEMLENDKARDICNKLTYEAETSDLSALTLRLNEEFKTMETALKNDFPELR